MPRRASLPEGKALFFPQSEPIPPERLPRPTPIENPQAEHPQRTTRQSAIFLEERHLDWLDDKCRQARHNGGRAVRKAAIIRALLDIAMSAPIDLTSLRREEDLLPRIRRAFRSLS